MLDNFITWDMLAVFYSLSLVTFMVVEFFKESKYIKKYKTKYFASIVAFVLIVLGTLGTGTFSFINIPLYALSAIAVTFNANGLSDFNNPVDKTKKE